MLSAIIVCDAGLSVIIMRVVYKFNSLFVLIDHEYQVLPTVKLPKYCSDETGAQVHRHTGDDWRDDGREKMPGERRSTCRMRRRSSRAQSDDGENDDGEENGKRSSRDKEGKDTEDMREFKTLCWDCKCGDLLWNRLVTFQDTHDQESNAPSAPLVK